MTYDMCFDDCHLAQRESTCLVKHGNSRVLDVLSRKCRLHAHQHGTGPGMHSG